MALRWVCRRAPIGLAVFSSAVAAFSNNGIALQSQDLCPRSCLEYPSQADWNNFYSVDELQGCGEPMLLTFATFSPIDDPDIQVKIRGCTVGYAVTPIEDLTTLPVCHDSKAANATAQWITGEPVQLTGNASGNNTAAENIFAALRGIQAFLGLSVNCDENIVYGYSQGVLVGLYAGLDIENRNLAFGFVETVAARLDAPDRRSIVQVCGNERNSNQHLGVAVDPSGDFAWTQQALRSWSEARCVTDVGSETQEGMLAVEIPTVQREPTSLGKLKTRSLLRSPHCNGVSAAYGDTPQSIASTCKTSVEQLRQYNKFAPDWTPTPHQWVCCSPGISKRADEPLPDGTCVSYVVRNQDTCSAIALKNGITEEDIYTCNKEMYGFGGCDLFPGQRICVGPGKPRMPEENPDAECGPTKPGTKAPTGDQKVEDLSPCPLKACCNIWGKCGIDSDFCVPTESKTGNPGTAAPRTNGCVQNCGMELKPGSPPAQFIKVGYYEAWNHERPCLHMTPQQIPSGYTHIHFSFAEITPSFGVSLGRLGDVFEEFKQMRGFKRIVAFGGWALSTEPGTYHLFPNAVKPENRDTFAQACVEFVMTHDLDGVDFDWEYPAQPDIPGIPPGAAEEADNYLEFVKLVKQKMPGGKTVSIAAPASYWYLKQFLIAEMAEHLDYIIYMTYDLHGQWDHGSTWAQPGCLAGNCLRSHVNMTETMTSLAMVTKAGVPHAKIIVGVTSYGRSFKMTDPSCDGPQCTYTGPASGAAKGKCTGTGGYISNGEMNEIIAEGRAKKQWTDETESNYLVYDDGKPTMTDENLGEWVSYMDSANKQARIAKYRSLNFGGSTDWAVDLEGDVGAFNGEVVYLDPKVYDDTPAQCEPPCLFVFPPSALPSPSTISIPAYTTSIVLQGGSTKTITIMPPRLTLSSMSFSNVNVTSGSTVGTIRPSASIDVPRVTTVIDGETRTILLPPWPAITDGPPSNWTRPPVEDDTRPPLTPMPPPNSNTWTLPTTSKPPFTSPLIDWPPFSLRPVPTPVPDEGEDDDNGRHKMSCRLWFFFVRHEKPCPSSRTALMT
ncbi:hypothetical protein B0I35DRAFT_504621 [Stachybotrys elegans]|uniref:chitinase n=1 Tax=Stachybotrys elegans TaxID=80388 RepID=A0A8K0SQM1_9HYPO|nr:hypothetical protein B0I35DRAFT_504621 [Stachybotrys elegans]